MRGADSPKFAQDLHILRQLSVTSPDILLNAGTHIGQKRDSSVGTATHSHKLISSRRVLAVL
jgi:hypothetical protein